MEKPHASKIDLYIIEQVKTRRKELGLSQIELAHLIDAPDSFVSAVESLKHRSKYNVRHLNLIAIALKCSPKDFWPAEPIL